MMGGDRWFWDCPACWSQTATGMVLGLCPAWPLSWMTPSLRLAAFKQPRTAGWRPACGWLPFSNQGQLVVVCLLVGAGVGLEDQQQSQSLSTAVTALLYAACCAQPSTCACAGLTLCLLCCAVLCFWLPSTGDEDQCQDGWRQRQAAGQPREGECRAGMLYPRVAHDLTGRMPRRQQGGSMMSEHTAWTKAVTSTQLHSVCCSYIGR